MTPAQIRQNWILSTCEPRPEQRCVSCHWRQANGCLLHNLPIPQDVNDHGCTAHNPKGKP